MIIQEDCVINGAAYKKTSSDKGVFIQKTGTAERYIEAIDSIPCPFTYLETDESIPIHPPTEEEKDEALRILGVTI